MADWEPQAQRCVLQRPTGFHSSPSQLCAAGEDQKLVSWQKAEEPVIALPPADMPLVGWRDPFIFEVGTDTRPWGMLMGSGLKGQGGAVMIYRSDMLLGGACLLLLLLLLPIFCDQLF